MKRKTVTSAIPTTNLRRFIQRPPFCKRFLGYSIRAFLFWQMIKRYPPHTPCKTVGKKISNRVTHTSGYAVMCETRFGARGECERLHTFSPPLFNLLMIPRFQYTGDFIFLSFVLKYFRPCIGKYPDPMPLFFQRFFLAKYTRNMTAYSIQHHKRG